MTDLASQGDMPQILAIETLMKTLPQVEGIVEHFHIDGVYVRALFIPKGTLLTGKIHNGESIGILAHGTLRIANGTTSKLVFAPYISVEPAGIKRLGYAETDCTFITVHKTDKVEIAEIEQELVSDTFEEYETKVRKALIEIGDN